MDDYKRMNISLLSKISALEERLKVRNKNLYAGKSQKGIHKKKREVEEDHTCDKDDFDGTPQSLGSSLPQPGEAHAQEENVEAKSKEARLYRQGLSYRTMSADNRVCHDSDIRQRFIRPLAGERKNSLFFGSDKMAGVSAVYHTIISTCRMQGVFVLDYFKRFFSEIVKGRRDYEHLLPLTIGLEQ
ncbi:hypothetical protein [Phocaeicola sartorii]|uniref:hypothetical protein n=1 Tax=Phocaeicola sartorii TaxID=671267 RepID=UPI0035116B2D